MKTREEVREMEASISRCFFLFFFCFSALCGGTEEGPVPDKEARNPASADVRDERATTLPEEVGNKASPETETEEKSAGPFRLEEILVSATRTERSAYDVPSFADVILGDDIRTRRLSRTVPEALKESTGVMVQKTGHGQGSPYIRGFTGFRTLLLIDGIRFNNSVFRDGPNQYWNTVDPLSLSGLEVVHGPAGSVLYGSDAVGGTVNARTRTWEDLGGGLRYGGSLFGRFSTAEHSGSGPPRMMKLCRRASARGWAGVSPMYSGWKMMPLPYCRRSRSVVPGATVVSMRTRH